MNCGEQQNITSLTFADYGAARFRTLCQGAGFGAKTEELLTTFHRLLTPWGNVPIGNQPHWLSNIGDDHSPIEFSVAFINQQPEVRVLMEVQGDSPTVQSQRIAGLAFNERLGREFGASLERLRLIQDLFLPEKIQGNFAIWNAVVFSQGREPSFKVYLNPQAQGSERAQALVEEALIRLGFPQVWSAFGRTVTRRGPQLDEIKYFALDLANSHRARVKIYVHHHYATPEELEIACSVANNYVPGEASKFALAMSGGNQLLSLRSPFTCPSFIEGNDERPEETTLYIPVCAYAHDDRVVSNRVHNYLMSHNLDSSLYNRILKSYATRALESGVGMQSWVSYRRQLGRPRLTVYLSTESYRVYPPGSIPASTIHPLSFNSAVAVIERLLQDSLAEHPFLRRLMREAGNTTHLWLLITNTYEGTSKHFILWLAKITAQVESDQLRCLLARQLNEELGDGDFSHAHSVLMNRFLDSIALWRPEEFSEAHLQPGKRLGERLAKHYLADEAHEGVAALMAGEICAQQLIHVVAQLIRLQENTFEPSSISWLTRHDEIEGNHAQESLVLARMLPDSEEVIKAVQRGAMGLHKALWNFLDEMYQLCFVGLPAESLTQENAAKRLI